MPKVDLSDIRLRIPKHDHIPHLPAYTHILNIFQLILSIVILGLTAAAVSSIHYSRSIPAFALFVSLASIVVLIYRWVSLFRFPALYNRLAVLVLEALLLVWWLSAFASLAAWSAGLLWLYDPICTVDEKGDRYCIYRKRSVWNGKKYRDVVAAAASLGALQFILSIVTLSVYAIHFHRLRKSGAPYTMHGTWTSPPPPNLTPTGITMTHTMQNPVVSPTPADTPAVGSQQFETTRAPPKIETLSSKDHLPIAEEFQTPLEGLVVEERGPEVVVREGEVKVKKPEIRHSGSFLIDDGIVDIAEPRSRGHA